MNSGLRLLPRRPRGRARRRRGGALHHEPQLQGPDGQPERPRSTSARPPSPRPRRVTGVITDPRKEGVSHGHRSSTKLGDDVSTDVIYPGRFMATVLPTETPQFAFADDAGVQRASSRRRQVPPGSVIVGREELRLRLLARAGRARASRATSCRSWRSGFARIFLQNAINLGLRLVIAPGRRGRARATSSRSRAAAVVEQDDRQDVRHRARCRRRARPSSTRAASSPTRASG